MILVIERILLELISWFYNQSITLSFVTLGVLGIYLMIQQFLRKGETVVPGLLGLATLLAFAFHIFNADAVIQWANANIASLGEPRGLPAIPLLEPLFASFVAPLEIRKIHQELIFVVILIYVLQVISISIKQYRITGEVLGEMSLAKVRAGKKRPERSRSNELGSADLATSEQIALWTKKRPSNPYDSPNPHTMLEVENLKGSEGISVKQGHLFIPRGERNRHMLIVAKTGGGKTTRFILPILYDDVLCKERSTIVIDSKPEMWDKLAQLTRNLNPEKKILLFNPLDTVRSLSWNILAKIENDTDAKLIANTIIMATDNPNSKSDSPFFRNNALAILNAVMVGLLNDKDDQLSMPRIHELVQSGMKGLCDWLEQRPEALRTSRTFIELARAGSQNADTIMSELSMRLAAWDLKAIRSTTWQDELDIESLIAEPTLFIVELRESELEMLRPMANVIVVEMLRFLTKRAESCPGHRLPRPVSLVIDEFASALGRLPDIHVKLNTLRSRNVSICAAIQSIGQVKANYGDDADSVLAGFSTKIFLPPLDLADSEWASKETGQMTIRFKTKSTGSNRKMIEWFASKNDGTQEQVQQRAVLTPDEIGRPVDKICTFFLPETPPFQGFLKPYFEQPEVIANFKKYGNKEKFPSLMLRDQPIEIKENTPVAGPAAGGGSSGGAAAGGPPPGITNTKGWTDDQLREKLEEVKKVLDWENTTGSAKKWWEAFENENKHRLALVLRLAEELQNRKATITEFFLAYVYSNTDNIQANLHYLDYTRLKKEEERKKKEAAAKAKDSSPAQAANA